MRDLKEECKYVNRGWRGQWGVRRVFKADDSVKGKVLRLKSAVLGGQLEYQPGDSFPRESSEARQGGGNGGPNGDLWGLLHVYLLGERGTLHVTRTSLPMQLCL